MMKPIALATFSLTLFTLAACSSSSPVADKALEDAVKVDSSSVAGIPADAKILPLPEQACVSWVGTKKSGKHDGGFGSCAGKVILAPDGALLGIEVTVDTTSLFSDSGMLTGHLKSADFFEVKTYPTATFVSSSVAQNEDGSYEVTGTFDVHGMKKERTFTATSTQTGEAWAGTATMTFMRSDHAISTVDLTEEDPIADEVAMTVKLATTPEQ